MRRTSLKVLVLVVTVLFFSLNLAYAKPRGEVDWAKFSKSLVKSLQSENEGVRLSAMQLVIKYGDKVNVTAARYEVMDTFLKHENQKVRQLALVTLYKINNVFDMGLLERQLKFEEDPVIQNQIAAILLDANRLHLTKSNSQYQTVAVANVD